MAMLWLASVTAIFAVLLILWFVNYLKYERHIGKYRGPVCIPIIGNMYNFGSGKDFLTYLSSCTTKYGSVIKFMFTYTPRLFVSDIKLIEFLLSSNFILEKSYDYRFFHNWLGFGLFTSNGKRWKQSRKLLTPAFHFNILERFVEIFEIQGNTLLNTLEKFDGKQVDIFPHVALYALDVICETSLHTTVNAQLDSKSDYVISVKEICRITFDRNFSPFKMWDPLYRLSRDYQKEKRALSVLHGYTNAVIKKRKQEIQNNPPEQLNTANDVGSKQKVTFLDILLQCQIDGKPLPERVIREEVDTIMFAGHDTTTSSISFTLYVLSKHQDIQEKVFEEVQGIRSEEGPVTYEDLQQMKYLEQVIKESLRLYPPAVTFARFLTEDVQFGDTILPKGLDITLLPYILHRDPNLYSNPEVFDPERFSPENSKNRLHYAYIPFSAGPRNCIGQRFAMLETKSAVSKIIRKFKLLPAPGHEPKLYADVVLKSDNGLPIRFQKRY